MSPCGYRRTLDLSVADDGNAVVSGHRADSARGHQRAPKLAPSLARFAEPPIGDYRATRVGMGKIRLAAEAFSAGRDACRAAAKVLAIGRGDLNQPFHPETQ
jgi:hypothetical protein